MQKFPYRVTFLIGLGSAGVQIISTIFNLYVPLLLPQFGFGAALVGAIMSIDNHFDLLIQPTVGALFDKTRSRLGRRRLWLIASAPLTALGLALIPSAHSAIAIVAIIALTNLAIGLLATPTQALLTDHVPSARRGPPMGSSTY
jgi:Na+/melibiose symporter-like transporter